jgi:protein TonB
MGHKTNGGWDDVTSIGRNEIVFEGRHKAYGAFYIRKRYNFALLISLLISLSAGVIISGIPIVMHLLAKPVISDVPTTTDIDHHTIYIQPPHVIKPTIQHPVATRPTTPKPPTNNNSVPVVVTTAPTHDSDKTITHPDNPTTLPGTTTSGDPTGPNTGPLTTGTTDNGGAQPPSDKPVIGPDVMPKFPGDIGTFMSNHADYPVYLREASIEGTVYATFVVERDGTVSEVKILRGVAGADKLSESTITAIKNMPKWIPGQLKGQPVRVQYVLPVHFLLK